MIQDYFALATKNLKHRGIRSWLTLLGILIGVAAVVALIGLGNGLTLAINSQFGVSETEVITIQAKGVDMMGPPGSGAVVMLTTDDLKVISKVNNVDSAIRRNIRSVKIESRDAIDIPMAMTIPESSEEQKFVYDVFKAEPVSGNLLDGNDQNSVLLGYNFFTEKKIWSKPLSVGDKISIQGKKFKVKGFVEKKGSFLVDDTIFINDDAFEDLMNYGDEVDLIVVRMKDKSKMEQTKLDLEKALRKSRDVDLGDEDFTVSTPAAALKTVNSVLDAIKIFVLIIAMISVFVGIIGIVNTMTTSVLERRRDIGIMKSIGAKNSDIFFQFFVEAGLLGLVGGILGATLGTLLSVFGIYGLNSWLGSEMTANIDVLLIILSLLGSFFVGAVAGIVPAMSAAKQNPVEALRS